MSKTIRFYTKCVWGSALYYPVDCQEAIYLLTGCTTLTPKIIKGMEMLGFNFREIMESQKDEKSPEDAFEQARRDA